MNVLFTGLAANVFRVLFAMLLSAAVFPLTMLRSWKVQKCPGGEQVADIYSTGADPWDHVMSNKNTSNVFRALHALVVNTDHHYPAFLQNKFVFQPDMCFILCCMLVGGLTSPGGQLQPVEISLRKQSWDNAIRTVVVTLTCLTLYVKLCTHW